MDLAVIADFADVVAALGIIGSLLFLAFQVRQNTRTVRNHVWETHLDRVVDQFSRTLDGHVAEVLARGRQSFETLAAPDRLTFAAWANEYLLEVGSLITFDRQGLLHPDVAAMVERRLDWFFKHRGSAEWWRSDERHPIPARLETVIGRSYAMAWTPEGESRAPA